MIFAHPFSNIVVNKLLQPFWKTEQLSKRQELIIWVTAIVSTVMPDFDLAYSVIFPDSGSHRFLITHTFAPYIPVFLLIILLTIVFAKQLNSLKKDYFQTKFIRTLVLVAFVGVSMHLLTDMLGAPVRILYPFSSLEFSISRINSFIHSESLTLALQYYTTPLFLAIEVFWITTGTLIAAELVKKNVYVKRYFPHILGSIVFAAACMLAIFVIIKPY